MEMSKRGEALPVSSFQFQKQRARVKANMARIHILEMGTQRSAMLFSKLFCIGSFNKYSVSIYYVPGTVLGSQDMGTKETSLFS